MNAMSKPHGSFEETWHAASVLRLINGYIRYLRDSKTGSQLGLQESPVPYGDVSDDDLKWLDELLAHRPLTNH